MYQTSICLDISEKPWKPQYEKRDLKSYCDIICCLIDFNEGTLKMRDLTSSIKPIYLNFIMKKYENQLVACLLTM